MQDMEGSHWQSLDLLLLCRGCLGPVRSLCGYRLRGIRPQPHGMVGPNFGPSHVTASMERVVGMLSNLTESFVEPQVLLCISHGTAGQIQPSKRMRPPCGE